ncbi:hypothetical protein ACFL0Z_03400 [Patescibacteria group bacterium]
MNTEKIGSILGDQELPLPESERSQGFLEGVFAPFSGLGMSMFNTGKGDFLTNTFLRFKNVDE